jgi:hypothetical protein
MDIKDVQNYFLSFFGSIETPEIEIESIEEEVNADKADNE